MKNEISRFLDEENRIKLWPSKKEMKTEILKFLADKFEYGQFYSEKEINAIIEKWHTFDDYFLLRRGLIDQRLLSRTKNGARYWREEQSSLGHIEQIIFRNYDIGKIGSISQINNGIGSNSYFILCDKGEFIFKDIEHNHMNYPENEDTVLKTLKDDGIPVPQIYKTINGCSVICDGNKKYHMQNFISGKIYKHGTAPEWLLFQSAQMLGRIQNSLDKLQPLPSGLCQNFFTYFTYDMVIENHTNTLKIAQDNNDNYIAEVLKDKIKLIQKHKDLKFDFSRMTCRNTHGDYSINQIICGNDRINAIIDFTSACVHPVCWEVFRSYLLADNRCRNGEIDFDNFKRYLEHYLIFGRLNDYDIEVMLKFYLYQSLVCDYFYQYYISEFKNKNILLENAMLTYKQCRTLSDLVEKDFRIT
ncbi:MAG TPA: DUF2087 domain-containing protein [Clostridia bacterium]